MRIAVLLAVFYTTTSLPAAPHDSESSDSKEDDDDDWECGTDDFSKYISENQIDLDCPQIKKTVNQCCVVHDKCYDDQLGRKHCDDTFCDCLDRVTRGYEICHKEDGPLFCNMVRHFGAEAYLRSGNHTSTVVVGESEDDLTQTTNATSIDTAANHDYDYESAVKLNDTATDNLKRETDLLATLLGSA
ncbi:hypothetical protein Aduo_003270 [Ancylostoma duodenale]